MDSFPPLLLVDLSSLTLLLVVLDLSSLTHLLQALDLVSLIVELYLSPPPQLSFFLPSVARGVVPLLQMVSLQPPLVPKGMLQLLILSHTHVGYRLLMIMEKIGIFTTFSSCISSCTHPHLPSLAAHP